MIRFANPLVLVDDVARSTAFYTAVLGLTVVEHHDNFVLFDNHFAIHDGADLLISAAREAPARPWGRDSVALYFETADPQSAFNRIRDQVQVVHGPRKEPWGQTIFRCLDPDGHLIEIGSPQVYDRHDLEAH